MKIVRVLIVIYIIAFMVTMILQVRASNKIQECSYNYDNSSCDALFNKVGFFGF
jgi:hypothetical protein